MFFDNYRSFSEQFLSKSVLKNRLMDQKNIVVGYPRDSKLHLKISFETQGSKIKVC